MRALFCIYDFTASNLRLQPWLTVARVAGGLARRGHEIHVLTDAAEPGSIEEVAIHRVRSLRGSNSSECAGVLRSIRPDAIVTVPTPLNLVSTPWLAAIDSQRVAFCSYPFYRPSELFRAARGLRLRTALPYLRHLSVPSVFWKRAVRSTFHAVIAQSRTTADRLSAIAGESTPVYPIPPGIDLATWPLPASSQPAFEHPRLLYLGAATPIRGFDIALNALSRFTEKRISLRVLARGAQPAELARIARSVRRRGLSDRVTVVGGWLDREALVREIHQATAVLLPFLLVPSELPVTAMEVIACGTPVIGSDIDGLPSTIGPAGSVVRQGSARSLAEVIEETATQPSAVRAWREGCRHQRATMKSWDAVAEDWEKVLIAPSHICAPR